MPFGVMFHLSQLILQLNVGQLNAKRKKKKKTNNQRDDTKLKGKYNIALSASSSQIDLQAMQL